MENFVFNSNTKLTVVYDNGWKPPHLFRIHTVVTLFGLKSQLTKSTVNSAAETHIGWMVLSIDVHRPTHPEVYSSAGWSSWTTTTWEPCSQFFVSTILEDRSSWTLRWSDLLKKFENVCSGSRTTKRSGYFWTHQTKELV